MFNAYQNLLSKTVLSDGKAETKSAEDIYTKGKKLYDVYQMGKTLGLFKQGGLVMGYPRRVGLMPVPIPFVEPQIMALGGAVMSRQIAHNTQLKKLGGKVRGKNIGNIDTIPTLLAVNEIVIPRKIAQSKKFKNYLSKNYKYNQKNGKFKK